MLNLASVLVVAAVVLAAEEDGRTGKIQTSVIGEHTAVAVAPTFSPVPLKDMFGKTLPLDETRYFVFLVGIENKSDQKKINYRGWGSNMFMAFAALEDNLGNKYKMISFGATGDVAGAKRSESIYPGKSTSDILVFEMPVEKAESFTLRLDGANVQEARDLVFKFPRNAIEDKEKEERKKAAEIEKRAMEYRRQQAAEMQKRKDAAEKARWRVWTSADGKFRTEAKFVRAGAGKVILQTEGGKEIEVAEEKLSKEDVRWIKTGKWKDATDKFRIKAKYSGIEKQITIELGGGVAMELVLIPAGEFVMGTPEAERQWALDEAKAKNQQWPRAIIPTEVQHRVKITKPFYLGKHEVTQTQWQAIMGSNPSHHSQGPEKPVDTVSWDDTQVFLARLNTASGMKFGLPTETQWEYACRAGSTTRFSFGESESELDRYAWWKRNSDTSTHPVGTKEPNAWGLYDMYGNVWEWCADWYGADYYRESSQANPAGPPSGDHRVLRGGSFNSHPLGCRSGARNLSLPDRRIPPYGFRVMCFH